MKLKLLTLCLLVPFLMAAVKNMSEEEAVEFAMRRYEVLKRTVNNHQRNELSVNGELEKCFGTDMDGKCPVSELGQCFQSDLLRLKIPLDSDEYGCITPIAYFQRIAEYSKAHRNFSFDYNIVETSCKSDDQPSFSNSEEPLFCFVTFKKKWMVQGKEIVTYEEVQVDLYNRLIKNINVSDKLDGGVVSVGIHKKPVKVEKTPPAINEEPQAPNARTTSNAMKRKWEEMDMFANASYLYKEKKYSEAFELYKEITIKYPNNDEAWHALGAMYFKNEGVSLSRKQRLEKSAECLRKSKLKKSCRALAYVTDGREGCYK